MFRPKSHGGQLFIDPGFKFSATQRKCPLFLPVNSTCVPVLGQVWLWLCHVVSMFLLVTYACVLYIYYTWACVYTNIYIYTYTPVYIYMYMYTPVCIYIYIHVLVVVLSCTVVAWIPRFRGLAPPRGLCCFSGGISKGSLPAHWGRPSTQPWGINQQWLDICGNIYII